MENEFIIVSIDTIMNDQTYLVIKDIDEHICSFLPPTSVLTMTEVNKHYRDFLRSKQDQFNAVKTDLVMICEKDHLWIAKWIVDKMDMCRKMNADIPYISLFYNKNNTHLSIQNINHLFQIACENGHKSIAEWLLTLDKIHGKINIHCDSEYVFRVACQYGHKSVAELLMTLEETHGKINIHAACERAFSNACWNGHKSIAEWLLTLEDTHGKIDIHFRNEEAFQCACMNGNQSVAEWLLTLETTHGKIDIHTDNEYAFRSACWGGHKSVAEWLLTLEATHGPFPKKMKDKYLGN